jgi:hypothetical protein
MKCPEHHVNYEVVKTSYEQYGVILKDVKALKCPSLVEIAQESINASAAFILA